MEEFYLNVSILYRFDLIIHRTEVTIASELLKYCGKLNFTKEIMKRSLFEATLRYEDDFKVRQNYNT